MIEVSIDDLLVPVDGTFVQMAVRIWRPETVRATVFCIHGFLGNGGDFAALAEVLAANDFKVVAPDLPGRGRSAPLGAAESYMPATMIHIMNQMTRYRENGSVMLATGWGGLITLAFLARTRAHLEALVINDVFLTPRSGADAEGNNVLKRLSEPFPNLEAAEAAMLAADPQFNVLPHAFRKSLVAERFQERGGHIHLSVDPHAFAEPAGRRRDFDLRPLVLSLTARTLIIAGRENRDKDQDAFLEEASARMPNLTVSKGFARAHPQFLAAPDQILLILGFLLADRAAIKAVSAV